MSDLYRVNLADVFVESLVKDGTLVSVEAQECKLARSEPVELGSGEIVYWITVVSDKPANSLTMHGELWLVPGAGIGGSDDPR